jgi:anthraniloyl-CoA monooxygenase
MRVACVGGGPAGLYLGILLKKANPEHEVEIFERNAPGDTFGFGVVFSDATLGNLERADPESYRAITSAFAHWDDIEIHWGDQVVTSSGHGFSGLSRQVLLSILERRAEALGVVVHHRRVLDSLEALGPRDLIVLADGVNSAHRERHAEVFEPSVDYRPNRFVWLGTTFPFRAFTFWFKQSSHGLWRVHAYRYDSEHSTFIAECTEATWLAAGLDAATEVDTIRYLERTFAAELRGHRLIGNRSIWRQFPTVRNRRWSHGNRVLLGDAAHTAHFSIGSGTKLAMEDAIALADALGRHATVPEALTAYEQERRPGVEATQRAAQVSLEWFENTERYASLDPHTFAMSLLTRSLRITHTNLKVRDPEFVRTSDAAFAAQAFAAAGLPEPKRVPPPMLTPLKLRELVLPNRVVVSPMCMYSAEDGTVNDWHLVHLGSRAIGGAGLVMTEMTDVSADGRITPGCAGLYRPEHVAAWARVVRFVHERSAAKIGVQLAHAGRKGSTRRPWEGGEDVPLEDGNWPLIAPSALPYKAGSATPRAMTAEDFARVLGDFVRSTRMAAEAGFDLLELHMAHGYLLASFLSPLTNVRTDAYGGSLENRLRFPLEVLDAVRAAWPAERPLSVRISAHDWTQGGNTGDEAVMIARALKAHGVDVVDVSSGQTVAEQQPEYGRLYQTPFADRIRQEVGLPTMTVGGVSTWSDANSILAAGRADLVALARAHLFDPYWTRHAAQAQGVMGRDAAWPLPYLAASRFSPRSE